MPNFGIPCDAPDPKEVEELIDATAAYLSCLTGQLLTPLNTLTQEAWNILGKIGNYIYEPSTTLCSLNSECLDKILATIVSSVDRVILVNTKIVTAINDLVSVEKEEALRPKAPIVVTPAPVVVTPATVVVTPRPQVNVAVGGPTIVEGPEVITVNVPPAQVVIQEQPVGLPVESDATITAGSGSFDVAAAGDIDLCSTFLNTFIVNIPHPASPAFCVNSTAVLNLAGTLGKTLLGLLTANSVQGTILGGVGDALEPSKTTWAVSPLLAAVMSGLAGVFKAVAFPFNVWDKVWSCAINAVAGFAPGCDKDVMLGLNVVNTIIHSIRHLRLEISWPVEIGIQPEVALDKVQETVNLLMNLACPIETPGFGEISEAWNRNYITTEYRDCLLRLKGIEPKYWEPELLARGEKVHAGEAIEYVRRNLGDFDQQLAALRSVGYVDQQLAEVVLSLYDELPSIQDHLHYLQRNVYDTDYVRDYQLLEGFEERFWANFGADLYAKGYTKKRARLDYAAHWVMPSPTAMQEFVHRLRPGTPGVTKPFTLNDYRRILTEQDYNIVAREWFVQTAYRVPALSYLKDMYRQNVIKVDDLKGYHQDLGYTEKDSQRFVEMDYIQKVRMRASASHGWTTSSVVRAWAAGQVGNGLVFDVFLRLGYNNDEREEALSRADKEYRYTIQTRARSRLLTRTVGVVKEGLTVGTMSPAVGQKLLEGIGWSATTAASIVQLELVSAGTARIKHAVTHLRSAFLSGAVDSVYVGQHLSALGLQAAAVQSYLSMWSLEQTPARKRRTASQITADVASGHMDVAEAIVRLERLGYDDADTRLYLADIEGKLAAQAAKQAAALAKSGRSQAAALAAAAKEAKKQLLESASRLQRIEPPAKLLSWLCLGTVSPAYAVGRLRLYGWPDLTIRHWLTGATAHGEQCLTDEEINQVLGTPTVIPEVPVEPEQNGAVL